MIGASSPDAVRSSPSLLRPGAQRLNTIESISSKASRSKSRSGSRGLQGSDGTKRRSQSAGPALTLDPVNTGVVADGRKGFLRLKKRGRKGKEREVWAEEEADGEERKDGKCAVM